MNEILDIDEINRRFASEWVLIDEPEVDEDLNVIRGKVVFHTLDRDELDRQMLKMKLKHAARFYAGSLPPDTHLAISVWNARPHQESKWTRIRAGVVSRGGNYLSQR